MVGSRTGSAAWIVALPVVMAAGAYAWILEAGLRADDFLHLFEIANHGSLRFLLTPHGGHAYGVRNGIFLLTHEAFGLWTEGYMATVLLTHLLNVVLCQRIATRLSGDPYAASAAAAAWGVVPSAVGTIGWYSVYGQVVATTGLGTTLLLMARWQASGRPLTWRTLLGWMALSWIAALCFGTGLAFALVLPVMVAIVAPACLRRTSTLALVLVGPLIVIGLYVGSLAAVSYVEPISTTNLGWSVAFAQMWARNLTVLGDLALVGTTELLTGPVWREPVAEGVQAAVALGFVVALPLAASGRRWRWVCALLLCTTAAYGMIAVGRGWYKDATSTLRYHYLAQFPAAIVLAMMLAGLTSRIADSWRRALLLGWSAALAVAIVAQGWPRRVPDAVSTEEMQRFRDEILKSASRTPLDRPLYLRNRSVRLGRSTRRYTPDFPGLAAWYCIVFDGQPTVAGHPVQIVEPDSAVRDGSGDCTGELFVTEAPPGILLP